MFTFDVDILILDYRDNNSIDFYIKSLERLNKKCPVKEISIYNKEFFCGR